MFSQQIMALSETGGHPGGQFESNSDSVASLRQEALTDLQRAWKSLRRLEDQSDDPAESKAAGKAREAVGKILQQLEAGS